MIDDGKDIEVKCHFCNTAYTFSVDELKELLKKADRSDVSNRESEAVE